MPVLSLFKVTLIPVWLLPLLPLLVVGPVALSVTLLLAPLWLRTSS